MWFKQLFFFNRINRISFYMKLHNKSEKLFKRLIHYHQTEQLFKNSILSSQSIHTLFTNISFIMTLIILSILKKNINNIELFILIWKYPNIWRIAFFSLNLQLSLERLRLNWNNHIFNKFSTNWIKKKHSLFANQIIILNIQKDIKKMHKVKCWLCFYIEWKKWKISW